MWPDRVSNPGPGPGERLMQVVSGAPMTLQGYGIDQTSVTVWLQNGIPFELNYSQYIFVTFLDWELTRSGKTLQMPPKKSTLQLKHRIF